MTPRTARPPDGERALRRRRLLAQEILLRATLALLVIGFDQVFAITTGRGDFPMLTALGILGLAMNGPYWLAALGGRWLRGQAYARMLIDVVLITIGLGIAGGLAAAPFLGVYMIVPVYVGLLLSRTAGFVATAAAPVAYLAMVALQEAGAAPRPARPELVGDWTIASFNLLMLALVGVVITLVGDAYRRSRARLARLVADLERATEESLRLNTEIQRGAHLSALGEVVAGVAHELGNVLTAALGHVSMARLKAAGRPELDEHLKQIEASFETASRIVRNTLETGRQSRSADASAAIADLARSIAELKAPELRRENIAVRLDFPAAFPRVKAVPYQVQQVLLNLVTNAQHALRGVPAPRVIDIAGYAEAGMAVVEVRDTGPGIPAEAIHRIFEPFFSTRPGGTGLGLAISAGIARSFGGELTAANRASGGAVFRLALPALPRDGVARRA